MFIVLLKKKISFGLAETGHDFDFQDKAFSSDWKTRRCRWGSQLSWSVSASALWLWWLITQDVVAGEPGLVRFLRRHHFPFLYKNNIVPPVVLTAQEIPLTVFLPSPAYFYSFGYFILGVCWAWFGRGKTYCCISGWTASIKKQTREDMVLGFWFPAWLCLHRAAVYPTPQGWSRPQGGFAAKTDSVQRGVVGRNKASMTHALLSGENTRDLVKGPLLVVQSSGVM